MRALTSSVHESIGGLTAEWIIGRGWKLEGKPNWTKLPRAETSESTSQPK
jgi:hypothetical protein